MDRRPIAVALAALLVLAGCSALPTGGDGVGGPTTDDPAETPDWVAQNQSLLDAISGETHRSLANASNFTIVATSNSTLLTPQRIPMTWRANQSRTVELDRPGRSIFMRTVLAPRSATLPAVSERYIHNGRRYQRSVTDGNVSYDRGAARVSFERYAGAYSNVTSYLAPYELRYDGTTSYRGRTVHVVRGTDYQGSMPALNRTTKATARAYLTDTGRAIRIDQTFRGTVNSRSSSLPATVRLDVSFRIRNVGSTDVTTPEWLSQFPNATASVGEPSALVAP